MKSPLKFSITALAMCVLAAGQLAAKDPMTENLKKLKGEEFDHKFVGQMIEHHQQGIEMAGLAQQRAQRPEIKQFAQKMSDKQQKEVEELKGLAGSGHHASASGTSSDRHVSTTAGISRSEETKGTHVGPTSTDKSSLTSGRNTGSAENTQHVSKTNVSRVDETRGVHTGSTDQTSHASTATHAGAPTGRTSHEGSSHEAMKTESMGKLQAAQGAEFDRVFTDEMIKHHAMAIEMSELAKNQASSAEVKQFAQKTIDVQKKEIDELKGFKRGASR
ncbi:MAG: DUF305 domain-containing protein [Opitutaceae bacterium]|nr:DUF305 domain-containing protein [Opitutaceae bacterium]